MLPPVSSSRNCWPLRAVNRRLTSRRVRRSNRISGDVVLVMDGWQDPQAYVDALKATPADLVILGMGMPKQEQVSMALKNALTHDCVIINGGAVIDFMAGKVARAPEAWRKAGLEWAYRLKEEPKRMFGRYVIGNTVFLGRAINLKLKTQEGDV